MSDKKLVLIIERSDAALSTMEKSEDGSEYIFEGIFGELNVKNKNKRFYTAEQYLPQIENLQQSITDGGLLGELDHPDRFNVKLSEASHRIEEIKLSEEDGRQMIRGRIKLLDTTRGKDAKALADGGVPLKISSRAAGVVESNGEVKLKKIFTYDLVHDPGFENAKLNRINESLGIEDDNIDVFEVPASYISEDEELSKIYTEELNINNKTNSNKTNSEKMSTYVTKEELESYSAHVKKNYDALSKKMDAIVESKAASSVDEANEKINKLVKHNDYIVEQLNKLRAYLDNEVVENVNNKFKEQTDTLENVKRYSQYLADVISENADESEAEFKKVDNIKEYAEYIAENTQSLIDFTDYISENLEHSIKHSDYIAENVSHIIEHNDHIVESINESTEEEKGSNTKFNFGSVFDSKLSQISESVDSLIAKSIKEKEAAVENLPGFLKLVNEDKVEDFNNYPKEVQNALVEAFEDKDVKRKSAVERVWENTVADHYKWEEMIPESLQENWENSTEERKEQIREEAEAYDLTTESKIQNFWETREFDTNVVQNSRRLRRQQFLHGKVNEEKEEVNEDYNDLVNRVKAFNKRN